ncbi:laminin subunit alpha-2-like [Tetranychus urticae]|nr:laminin subunit alpha-2-like [Tetranychus urticae]
MYDEKHIGLWDFSYTSPTGCKPCSKSALESGEYGVFQFNGKSSYSVLDQIPRYDNRNYQVVMLMRTFDESAIIFFCSDVDTGNYIAIHIVNGRVSFSFRDSPETWLKLVTTDKYNNGEWFRVTAARSETRAILSVDKENIEGEVEAYNSDLGDCKIHFGGVPPNFTTHHWPNLDFKPFLGCMKDVKTDTTPLNLMNGETFGLSTGCKIEIE